MTDLKNELEFYARMWASNSEYLAYAKDKEEEKATRKSIRFFATKFYEALEKLDDTQSI